LAVKDFEKTIWTVAGRILNLLVKKNEQYGNSVFEPVRIFSKAEVQAGLRIRIDDKLSRLARGNDSIESDVDIVDDLIGYLILLRIAMEDSE
jgi:uncharacterized protein (DUF2461 family)